MLILELRIVLPMTKEEYQVSLVSVQDSVERQGQVLRRMQDTEWHFHPPTFDSSKITPVSSPRPKVIRPGRNSSRTHLSINPTTSICPCDTSQHFLSLPPQVGMLHGVAMASLEETGGGEGVEVLRNEPYENVPLMEGKFNQVPTHKVRADFLNARTRM